MCVITNQNYENSYDVTNKAHSAPEMTLNDMDSFIDANDMTSPSAIQHTMIQVLKTLRDQGMKNIDLENINDVTSALHSASYHVSESISRPASGANSPVMSRVSSTHILNQLPSYPPSRTTSMAKLRREDPYAYRIVSSNPPATCNLYGKRTAARMSLNQPSPLDHPMNPLSCGPVNEMGWAHSNGRPPHIEMSIDDSHYDLPDNDSRYASKKNSRQNSHDFGAPPSHPTCLTSFPHMSNEYVTFAMNQSLGQGGSWPNPQSFNQYFNMNSTQYMTNALFSNISRPNSLDFLTPQDTRLSEETHHDRIHPEILRRENMPVHSRRNTNLPIWDQSEEYDIYPNHNIPSPPCHQPFIDMPPKHTPYGIDQNRKDWTNVASVSFVPTKYWDQNVIKELTTARYEVTMYINHRLAEKIQNWCGTEDGRPHKKAFRVLNLEKMCDDEQVLLRFETGTRNQRQAARRVHIKSKDIEPFVCTVIMMFYMLRQHYGELRDQSARHSKTPSGVEGKSLMTDKYHRSTLKFNIPDRKNKEPILSAFELFLTTIPPGHSERTADQHVPVDFGTFAVDGSSPIDAKELYKAAMDVYQNIESERQRLLVDPRVGLFDPKSLLLAQDGPDYHPRKILSAAIQEHKGPNGKMLEVKCPVCQDLPAWCSTGVFKDRYQKTFKGSQAKKDFTSHYIEHLPPLNGIPAKMPLYRLLTRDKYLSDTGLYLDRSSPVGVGIVSDSKMDIMPGLIAIVFLMNILYVSTESPKHV